MSIPSLCQDIQTILNKVSCLDPLSPKILDNLRLFGAVEHAAYSGLVGWRKREKKNWKEEREGFVGKEGMALVRWGERNG